MAFFCHKIIKKMSDFSLGALILFIVPSLHIGTGRLDMFVPI